MPITMDEELIVPTQQEFAELAYDVMNCFFAVHNEVGRFCEEKIYKREVARRFGGIRLEFPITLTHRDYRKQYFSDMLIRRRAIFEVKAVEALAPRHKAQATNYLLLTELPHGKLLNVRSELIHHEFVNASLMRADRTRFRVEDSQFEAIGPRDAEWKEWLMLALRDWGAGLEVQLYDDALTAYLGGEALVLHDVAIVINAALVGEQKGRFCGDRVVFKISTLPDDLDLFERHARRFLSHTALDAVQWVNINRDVVTFKTLWRRDGLILP
jgi:GxxExxY protein